MHTHRIGVHYERTAAGAEFHNAKRLLGPAEQQANDNAYHGTQCRDEPAFEQEDAGYLAVGGTQVAQRHHIVALINDEHGERADDVEAGHHEDERQEDVGNQLFYLHDLKCVVLLLKAVLHTETVSGNALHLGLHLVKVASGLQPQLQRRHHVLLLKETSGKAQGGNDVVLVVFRLLHVEQYPWREQLVGHKAIGGIGHVQLAFTPWRIDAEWRVKPVTCSQLLCQPQPQDAIVHVGGMQLKRAIANEYLVDVGQVCEVIIHTLYGYHCLMAVVDGQRLVFHAFRGHFHLG